MQQDKPASTQPRIANGMLGGVSVVKWLAKPDGGSVLLLGTSHASDREQMRWIATASEEF